MTNLISHVHYDDWAMVRALEVNELERLALLADLCRIDTLYMIRCAGSGHLGSSFSSLDIVAWVLRDALASGDPDVEIPLYFSSKGHDVPGLYSALIACGRLPREQLHQLRRLGGLPGHPDVGTPGMVANCGSLGMGISKAKGLITAARIRGEQRPVVVMTGDGELQEGQIWESLGGAANRGMSELRVVVDHNKIQSDTLVSRVSDLGDLEAKFAAFGWNVARCDGHDLAALRDAFATLDVASGPGVVICDTVKGRGVSFMERLPEGAELYGFHSGAPDLDTYRQALDEIVARVDERLSTYGAGPLRLQEAAFDVAPPPIRPQRLMAAYADAIVALADRDERVVALDGDLVLDTGLVPFAAAHPDRFVECGIAEQDMVGQAGGLALAGLLPIVHSFSCFLTTRPAEQIGTNASEGTKVLYVGSLSGVVPGGPGHSHQSVRDVALMASVPGMVIAEPAVEAEVAPLLAVLAGDAVPRSGYLRLVSVPVEVPFELPEGYQPVVGRGWTVREGRDLLVVGAGPVVLAGLHDAAERLSAEDVQITVVAMPWLNLVDREWFRDRVAGHRRVVAVENHLTTGGLADSLRRALDEVPGVSLTTHGLTDFPVCGRNDEVLAHHGLDGDALTAKLRDLAAS